MFLKENEYDVKDNKFINVYIIFFSNNNINAIFPGK